MRTRRLLACFLAFGTALSLPPLRLSATTEDTAPKTRSNPVIATPEAVKADFHSGGIGYTYKIDLPPAAGIVPDLALSFSSLTGNTEYGRGWTLNLSKIERSTRFGLPSYEAPNEPPVSGGDRFELDGSLLVLDPNTENRFHLERTDHRRILYDTESDSWEVTAPDGTRFLYGSREDANSTLDNFGRQDEPDEQDELPLATFRWSLDQVIDPRGNRYEIDYEYETFAHPQPSPGAAIVCKMNNHPKTIRYSYHSSESAGRDRRIVEFEWGMRGEANHNDDRPTSYRSGFKIQVSKRLTNIYVGTDTDDDDEIDVRVRRYEFLYAPKPVWNDAESEKLPPFSQLVAIQRYGKTDADVFPSRTDFGYTRPNRGWGDNGSPFEEWKPPGETHGVDFSATGINRGDGTVSALLDMNGDGFVDFVFSDPATGKLWVAYGPVKDGGPFEDDQTDWGFAEPVEWATGPSFAYISDSQHPVRYGTTVTTGEVIDMDGDGLPDRVESTTATGGPWRVARNLGNGFGSFETWNAPGLPSTEYPWNYAQDISLNYDTGPDEGAQIVSRLVDVNGDGRPDHVTGANDGEEFSPDWNQVRVSINNGSGFDEPVLMPFVDLEHDPLPDGLNDLGTILFSWTHPYTQTTAMLADANGDGLADRFDTEPCLAIATQQFSLGDGWQTPTRTGQGHADYGAGTQAPGEDEMCEDGSLHPKHQLSTELEWDGMTLGALLDLDGDGINDYYHHNHGSRGSTTDNEPMAWFGLGDGTYLSLAGGPQFPTQRIGPGIPWQTPYQYYEIYDPIRVRIGGINSEFESWFMGIYDTLDMNGDGLLDQVYFGLGGHPDYPYLGAYRVYLHPGPSGLLETVTNELGGVTRLTYKPSTWFRGPALATTEGAVEPESLPASVRTASPQWLLASITVEDGRTAQDQPQSIEYAGLRYDTAQHEYLGARMSEVLDAESVLTRRFFHQTPDRLGMLEFEEVENANAEVWRTQKTTWATGVAVDEDGNPVPGSWFARPTETRTTLRDPSSGNVQTRVESRTYDAGTGNLLTQRDWGANLENTADDYEKQFTYKPNLIDWLVSYPSIEAEFLGDSSGGDYGKVELFYYDQSTDLEQPPTQGLITSRDTLRAPGEILRERWTYDAFGNQTAYFDARAVDELSSTPTRETVYDLDFQVFQTQIRNALLHPVEFRFDTGFGEVTKVRDANGYLKCWAYDAFGRLTTLTERGTYASSVDDACTSLPFAEFEYISVGDDPSQQHILETLESGSAASDVRSRRFFDGLGRVYQEEAEQNAGTFAITVRGWGPRGEQACESLPFHGPGGTSFACDAIAGARIETSYDALLRPLETRRAVGTAPNVVTTVLTTSSYSIGNLDGITGNERIETRTDWTQAGPDRISKTASDPSGRPVAIEETSGGGLTRLVRDAKGRIVWVDGPVTEDDHPNDLWITYNHLDQRTYLSGFWPAGGWSYAYDLDGNLSVQTSPAGKTIRFHWDVLDRLALKDYGAPNTIGGPGIGEDIIYTYDTAPSYGIGRLALVDTPDYGGVDTSFGYDLRGRVASKVRNFGESGAYAFSYVYDAMGRRVFANLPNGKAIRHFYDGSVLEEIRIGPPYPGTSIARNVLLHPSGAIARIDYLTISGGSTYTYEPDTHRLATATSSNASGTLQNLAFDHDLAGNLTSTNDALGELSQDFTYDGLHRLVTATGSGSSGYGALAFAFDDAGNLLSKGAASDPLLLSYGGGNAGPHGVTSVTGAETGSFAYDADGQVTAKTRSGNSQGLIRDADGRIQEVFGFASCLYDETGERVRKTAGAADTLYVDPEYEVDLVDETHEIHYFHGSRRVATEHRSGTGLPGSSGGMLSRQFYFPDFVGSNSVVARNDGTLQKSFFRPFGEFAQQGGGMTPYLFTDQEHDPETNLQYFGARYYDPWVGRFLEQDPELIGAHEGGTFAAIADDAQQYNSYSYVTNRPTVLVDPSGRQNVVEAIVRRAKELTKDSPGKQVEKLAEKMEGKFDRVGTGGDTVGDETIPKPSIGDVVDGVVAAEAARSGGTAGEAAGASNAGEAATGTSNAASGGGGDGIGRGGPPRDPSTGDYTPSPSSEGAAHTTLGTRTGSDGKPYTQGATFDSEGNFLGRTDVTDHGRGDHSNPHFHDAAGPNRVEKGSGKPIPRDSHPLDGKL